ncbi:cupin domain-containing protein [Canibacter zhoujuaniae]|uniref:cupin domain-containing protein n=1 Tax=Canibacter zhoujuaniae TaxID=2708343 RepID=UPI00141E105C|nr:cupin domain-containing protein [Canibacter zhoujuaniae]
MSIAMPEGVNGVVNALTESVELHDVEVASVVSGSPRQGVLELGTTGARAGATTEVGIWELSAGEVTDTEIDEIFVVISGAATIELLEVPGHPAETGRVLTVAAGDVVRLVAGTRTKWTVTERIRKIYFAV